MTTEELFTELESITNENIQYLENTIPTLSMEQLTWKARKENWNIREILAHLLEFANYFNSAFAKKIDTTRFRIPRETFISSPLGKSMWTAMKLGNAQNVKRKIKSSKLYDPLVVPSIVTPQVEYDFLQSQKDLFSILQRAKTINVRKAKVALAQSKVIKFRIGDALLYVVYHNQRHIQQIINITKHPQFPIV